MKTAFHTQDDLMRDLGALGLQAGDRLFVHASLRAVGPVIGGPRVVIESLQGVLGPDGLLGMPGFSTDAYFPDDANSEPSDAQRRRIANAVPGFDLQRSPTDGMGIVAELFRTWPGTHRSDHPAVSLCLNGHGAADLIKPHSLDWALGPQTPMGALCEMPIAKVALIGVGRNRCSALHTAETLAETRRTKIRRVKIAPERWAEMEDVADDMNRLFPDVGAAFEQTGAVTRGRLGAAETRVCGLADLVAFAAPWISAANRASGDRH
ncbi:aminoglycoside N(3)-acetyltransferase [Roseovarius sp. S4756]|uniref:aminoglycoside N(3)-acetyltransferase n=1 Tax=Roseovarius maritimus TaxID=3342637 RepID=UPI00372A65F7